jgi:ribonuclease P/MRP protein subunit RPP40
VGKVGFWVSKFLDSSCRQQAVAEEGRLSGLSPVISGVPQGTLLGPILFLLHISCISREVSSDPTVSSYVDDTRVTRVIMSPSSECPKLQQDLQAIYRYAKEVDKVFNGDEFEMLRFWQCKIPNLGVQVSSDLTFSIHIENVPVQLP